ncbi:MAG TPA: bifunctional diguanylate cyclase/phosphodiesterase [Gaiellaceae bacterium]
MDAQAALMLPYRLRTVRIGLQTSAAAIAALLVLLALPDPHRHTVAFVLVLAVEVVGATGIALLPWRRLFLEGRGLLVQYAWLSGNLVLIALAVATTGGSHSQLYLLYGLTTAYAAAVFPLRGQITQLVTTAALYVAVVAATGWHLPAADLFLRLTILAILGLLTGFLSRESARRLLSLGEARAESESRARQLALLAAEKEHLSLHDPLTGLPNRSLFHDRVEHALAGARRNRRAFAVMLLDLDRFKEVNDSLGHAAGDAVLCAVGPRLAHELREADTLARLGGDEFALLLPEVADVEAALATGRRICAALQQPFVVDGVTLDLAASVGVALHAGADDSVDVLLTRADLAMYRAKDLRSGCELAGSEDDPGSSWRLALLGDLRRALEADELELHYQPKVSMRDRGLLGVEALLRWHHPEHGLVPPDRFIPLVEQTGLVGPLTLRTLDLALTQARAWADAEQPLTVAVNTSARNLHNPDFPAEVAACLRSHGVPAERLELELTESALMANPAVAHDVLAELAGLGVRIVLDDFGTGHTSLAHLWRLPVRELKIDRSFVLGVGSGGHDEILVRTMIDLGVNLGLRVVAEGVETEAGWQRLVELGCDAAQGYHIARPAPAPELDRWLRGRSTGVRAA